MTPEEIKKSALSYMNELDINIEDGGMMGINDIVHFSQSLLEQHKQEITDEEINNRFPLTYNSGRVELDSLANKHRQEGAKLMRDNPQSFKEQ